MTLGILAILRRLKLKVFQRSERKERDNCLNGAAGVVLSGRVEEIAIDFFRSHTTMDIQSRLIKIYKQAYIFHKKDRSGQSISAHHETDNNLKVKLVLDLRGFNGFIVGA